MKGETLFQEGLYGDALPFFEEVFEKDKSVKGRLAFCYVEKGELEKAEKLLSPPETAEETALLAFCLRNLKKEEESKQLLLSSPWMDEDVLQIELAFWQEPQKTASDDAHLVLVWQLIKNNDLQLAKQRLKLIRDSTKKAYLEGLIEEKKGAIDKALDLFVKGPKEPYVYRKQALLLLQLLEDPNCDSKKRLKLLEKVEPLIQTYFQKELYLSDTRSLDSDLLLKGILALHHDDLKSAYLTFRMAAEDPKLTFIAKMYEAEALFRSPSFLNKILSFFLMDSLLQDPTVDDAFVLRYGEIGYFVAKLTHSFAIDEKSQLVIENWVPKNSPKKIFLIELLAKEMLKKDRFQDAFRLFDQIDTPEALFWKAYALEKEGSPQDTIGEIRKELVQKYPESPLAPEAAFRAYTKTDYLQGDRKAMKWLKEFTVTFENSPFVVPAWFLMGLDAKRDRKSKEGKWLQKKNLNLAIDAFQRAEGSFERLQKEDKIPPHLYDQLLKISWRAGSERANANLSIAKESEGTKRRIYLEYAEAAFDQILIKVESDAILREASFSLGETYLHLGKISQAKSQFLSLINCFQTGYFPSRAWYELGKLSLAEKAYALSIDQFSLSEKAAQDKNTLKTDEWLDLWIQKAIAYQGLSQSDEAIRLLSKVINEDVVSSLRLKAMYLRGDVLLSQGKPELARKQWLALSKKGGEWGSLAKRRIEEESK